MQRHSNGPHRCGRSTARVSLSCPVLTPQRISRATRVGNSAGLPIGEQALLCAAVFRRAIAMRILAALSVTATAVFLMAATPTPENAWKAGIADENKAYAKTPHAMLKIQDAAYLHEGETAVLMGRKGVPASYRWK